MIQQEVAHVADAYEIKAAPVSSDNIVTSLLEYSYLPELGPSLQVTGPTALAEVAGQIYKTVLHNDVRYWMAPQDPRFFKVRIQVYKDNRSR